MMEAYIPSRIDTKAAMAQTTDLCIAAHHDDIEIMAYGPISACYASKNRHFTGVVVTDGGGSARIGAYADYTDDDMKAIRAIEQKSAATIGRYSAQLLLAHPSSAVKDPTNRDIIDQIKQIIQDCKPDVLYTHNLADKHDTHVAVAMHVIRALRELPMSARPDKIVTMEVWRNLDWLCDEHKVVYDNSAYPNVAAALLNVYDSQISGGKRYDLAAIGRRLANATFFASHSVDDYESATFGLDITELVNSDLPPSDFIAAYINKFCDDVTRRVSKFS